MAIETVKIVFVGPEATAVDGVGDWEAGAVKDVNVDIAEWLLTHDRFKRWESAPNDRTPEPKSKASKSDDTE